MLQGKTALITGSTSGIGLEIARSFANQGCNVIINGFGEGEKIAQQLSGEFKIKTLYLAADLSKTEECSRLAQASLDHFGAVHILVNNAGIQHVAPVEKFGVSEWEKVLSLNLTAAFCLIKGVLPSMYENNWGRIINIASVHGLVGSKHKAAYVAAKHGLLGLTKVVALETAETPITCNAICPGWVLTPLVERQIRERALLSGKSFEEEKEALLSEKQPSKDFVTSQHLGEAAVFLCSEAAKQMRGSHLTIDGCWTAQ